MIDNEKFRKLLPYLIVFVSFCGIIILTVILLDWIILPAMIHSGETVKVPNVVGKPLPEAEKILGSAGLAIAKVSEQFNDAAVQGVVLNQMPKPGQMVKAARSVYITISKGQETVYVPYVVGQPSRSARILLKNKGLEIGNVEYASSDSYGPDTVTLQKTASGRPVPFGSKIDLVVSKGGQSQVKIPKLEGLKYDDAVKTLQESGLAAGSVSYVKNETYLPNTVVSQSPSPGDLVNKGTAINVTITK